MGAKGTCEKAQEICICPDGFSGTDHWFASEACYVDERIVEPILQVSKAFTIGESNELMLLDRSACLLAVWLAVQHSLLLPCCTTAGAVCKSASIRLH